MNSQNYNLDIKSDKWKVVKISEVSKIQGGYAFKSKDYVTKDGIKLLKIANVSFSRLNWEEFSYLPEGYSDGFKDYLLNEGDVVMPMTRPVVSGGIKVAMIEEKDIPCLLNQRVCRFITNEKIEGSYLYFNIFTKQFIQSLVGGALGSQQPNISSNKIGNIEIPLPPLSEQRNIAFILSIVQQAIEKTHTVIQATQELKKSLMKHLFTYGPVPITEREQVQLKETEIGEIPEEWNIDQIANVCEFTQYGTSKRCNRDSSGTPVLRIPNIIGGVVDTSDLKYISLPEEEMKRIELNKGDLLFVRTNGNREYVGRCAVYHDEFEKSLFASYLIRLRLKTQILLPDFVRLYAMTHKGKRFLSGRASASSDGKFNINSQTIKITYTPVPDISIQEKIIEFISIFDLKIRTEYRKKIELERLFKSFLEQLMTGKIRVKDLSLNKLQSMEVEL